MKFKLRVLILIAMTIMNVHAEKKTINTNDFIIQYDECVENYAKASLKILKVIRNNAVKMGFHFQNRIELHMIKSDKNKLYVRGDNPNLITWEYKSINDFQAPQKSGYNNVYGLCHEMGHVCMENITPSCNWMTKDYEEGWANYFGSLMIENVYKNLGVKAWPDPHDYHKSRGMQSFLKGIKSNKSKDLKSFFYCSSFWYNLSSRIGKNNIRGFFYTLKLSNINISNSDIRFLDMLRIYKLDADFIADFQKNKGCLLISEKK